MIENIHQLTNHPLRRICSVLGISRSSYYNYLKTSDRKQEDLYLLNEVTKVFRKHKKRYGYRRIVEELADQGISCSPERVRRLMRQGGLIALQPKTFVPKTSDGRADKPSPNLIEEEGIANEPNQTLAGDITHIPTSKGWLYLAVVIDLHTRKIVGWKLDDNMRSTLVTKALENSCIQQSIKSGCVFHSDRGSQYGGKMFRTLLKDKGIRQSMSGRANPYDNAWTESVIGTLKRELLQGGKFDNAEDAKTEIFEYIESYYNTQRKHSSLDYLTPSQAEKNFHNN